jgi:hypothetical protein
MNCLYKTLFFNIVADTVQTFIKSWNQLLCPRVIEVCRQPSEPRHNFLRPIIVVELFPSDYVSLGEETSGNNNVTINSNNLSWISTECSSFVLRNRMTECTSHLAGLWISAAISNTSHSKPVIPRSNEYGPQVKDQGQRQCCHNKNKKFPYWPTHDVSLLSGHALYTELIK